jgi:hypothetical protein
MPPILKAARLGESVAKIRGGERQYQMPVGGRVSGFLYQRVDLRVLGGKFFARASSIHLFWSK